MKVLSVLMLFAAFALCTEAYWGYGFGYYYPYSFAYYPYYSWYGGLWWGKRAEEPAVSQRTECVYIKNDQTFKCRGPLGEVECEAEWKLDESVKLEMFGIGKPDDFKTTKMFKLFPRKLDNSGWMSNVIMVDGEDLNVTLHQGETHDLGMQIKDFKCFDKIADLLKDSIRDELIHLEDIDTTERLIGDFSMILRAKRAIGKYDDEGMMVEEEESDEKEHVSRMGNQFSHYNHQ